MRNTNKRLILTVTLGLGLTLALLALLSSTASRSALAQSGTGVLRVATTGSDTPGCGGEASPCCTVQYAVDQALSGEEIRVASGTYTGVNNYAGLAQVVYIEKDVTVRGGYTATNWTTPDPDANPTTLDAQGEGRVLFIRGDISATIEGLRITGGDATGLGGGSGGYDAGGGVYVYQATVAISNCAVYSNTASSATRGHGGGLYLESSDAMLDGNTVQGNIASTADSGYGGGLYLLESDALVGGNIVEGNTASIASYGYGGGLYFSRSAAMLSDNTVLVNTASTANGGYGGGLYLEGSDNVTLSGNTVQGNTASTATRGYGGGLGLRKSDNVTLSGNAIISNTASTATQGYGGGLSLRKSDNVTLSGNAIVSNTATLSPTATGRGGGLRVEQSNCFTLTNNLVADNHANTEGSGVYFRGTSSNPVAGCLLHTTIADNGSTGLTAGRSSGQGVYVGNNTTLAFTNTIISGHHRVGINASGVSTATLEATLWYNNGSDTGGGGTIATGTVNVYDDPAFADPSVWDYHLTAGSAAIDAGVDAGVTTDIDGDTRPWSEGYDIGADEFRQRYIYLPLVLRRW
jgi:parallel beta-helix repeat protein